jgi:hypothetical protein
VFLAVAALSMLASNKRLLEVGELFQLAQIASSGLSFLLMGVLLGPNAVGLLTAKDLDHMHPLIALGLGTAGLLVGLNLDPLVLRRLPLRLYAAAAVQAGATFVVVAVPLAVVFAASSGSPFSVAAGAAGMLGAAASLSSPHVAMLWYRSGRLAWIRQLSLSLVAMLDDLVGLGVLALALALALGAGSVLLALIFGIASGALLSYLLQGARMPAEVAAVVMGGVALVAGAATSLRISALLFAVACGATVAVIGGRMSAELFRALLRFERPIFLGLMFLVGAHVDVRNVWAWLLLPAFVGLRFVGKRLGGTYARRLSRGVLALPPHTGYALLAQGGLSLCIATEYLTLTDEPATDVVFAVVALGAVLNEALAAQLFGRALEPVRTRRPAITAQRSAP